MKGLILAAIIGMVLLLTLAACSGGTEREVESVVGTPTLSSEQMAYLEALATSEAKPTEQPKATSTPAAPALSRAECDYLASAADISDDVGEALSDLGGLFGEAADDPLVLLDTDWTIDVALRLAILQMAHDQALDLSPPEGLGSVHQMFLAALSKFDAAADVIAGGIDAIDVDRIVRGADLLRAGTVDIEEASAMFDTFARTRRVGC